MAEKEYPLPLRIDSVVFPKCTGVIVSGQAPGSNIQVMWTKDGLEIEIGKLIGAAGPTANVMLLKDAPYPGNVYASIIGHPYRTAIPTTPVLHTPNSTDLGNASIRSPLYTGSKAVWIDGLYFGTQVEVRIPSDTKPLGSGICRGGGLAVELNRVLQVGDRLYLKLKLPLKDAAPVEAETDSLTSPKVLKLQKLTGPLIEPVYVCDRFLPFRTVTPGATLFVERSISALSGSFYLWPGSGEGISPLGVPDIGAKEAKTDIKVIQTLEPVGERPLTSEYTVTVSEGILPAPDIRANTLEADKEDDLIVRNLHYGANLVIKVQPPDPAMAWQYQGCVTAETMTVSMPALPPDTHILVQQAPPCTDISPTSWSSLDDPIAHYTVPLPGIKLPQIALKHYKINQYASGWGVPPKDARTAVVTRFKWYAASSVNDADKALLKDKILRLHPEAPESKCESSTDDGADVPYDTWTLVPRTCITALYGIKACLLESSGKPITPEPGHWPALVADIVYI